MASRCTPVRCVQDRLYLCTIKVADDRAIESLHGNGQYLLGHPQHPWLGRRGVTEEGTNRCQAGIAAAGAVAAGLFQVRQERQYPRGVQVFHAEGIGLDMVAVVQEPQEESERVAIGGNGPRAQIALADQVGAEVSPQGRT